ncbi:MAG: T9SS type A sorting domain-containing protein [Bernardetiaceae bacterium]|nr:T9SS type A sorting domain-containing protein [Bernardetiaceae bacterium]
MRVPLLSVIFWCGLWISAYAQKTFVTAGNWSTSSNWSPPGLPAATDNVVIDANCTVDVNAECNNLTINSGRTLTVTSYNFTVHGNMRVQTGANFTDDNNSGVTTFKGWVRIDSLGSWNTTAVTNFNNMVFEGGIISLAGPTATSFNAGGATFAKTQNLFSRTFMIFNNSVRVGDNAVVNSQALVRIWGILDGASSSSTWKQERWYHHHPGFGPFSSPDPKEAGGILEYGHSTQPMNTGNFDVNYFLSTVNYIRNGAQTIRPVNYYNLQLTNGTNTNPANTKTMNIASGELRVDGILTIYDSRFEITGAGKLKVTRSSIGRNGRFINSTTSKNTNVGGFNTMDYYTGQFDEVDAQGNTSLSSNNNTFVFSSSPREFTFMRGPGPGGTYAVKTTNFSSSPDFVIIQAEISTRTIGNTPNAAELSIGDGFTADISRPSSPTSRIRINLVTGNQFSITYPDGGGATSAIQSGQQTLTWVVNRSGASQTYTAPDGSTQTVLSSSADVWIGTTQFANDVALSNASQNINDIKFVFDDSNSTNNVHGDNNPNQSYITLRNLRIFTNSPAANQIAGIVNRYAEVTNITVSGGNTNFTVNSSTGFSPGDRILIIQMKGATIVTGDVSNFGTITNYNSAGRYEFAVINSVPNGTTISIAGTTTNTYNPAGRVQIIRVPTYSNATIVAPVTGLPWNGTTGGVVVLWVNGTLTLNSDIDVSNLGFRGGAVSTSNGSCSIGTWATDNTGFGQKGEGIAETTTDRARARLANGGGGGNPHNSGGGGGSNFGPGADGGRQWNCTINTQDNGCASNPLDNPTSNNGGKGGVGLDYSQYRLFLGGGGGGGQQNNNTATPGGNGGGIVIIQANEIVGNGYAIIANGQSVLAGAGGDSSGGGGAGGSILINCPTYNTPIIIHASGGKGGDVDFIHCHGNGGGGGGGLVRLNRPLPPVMSIYNNGGISSRNRNNSDCALQGNMFFCAEASGLGGQIFENLTPTPVEISHFGAERTKEREARIFWTTTWERDHSHFEVQKSRDGIHFVTFSTILGNSGNSYITRHYETFDTEPHPGVNYYRLKQVDLNGTVSYTKIAVVIFHDLALQEEAVMYPNPATAQQLFLRTSVVKETPSVVCYDLAGRRIDVRLEHVGLGEFRVQFLQEMTSGVYLFKIRTAAGEYLRRVVLLE